MIRTTPALAKVISEKKEGRGPRDAENTLSFKMFPGGYLALGGANTPNTFARRSVRLAMGDDVDRFPAVVGEEGDPTDLLANRTETFFDSLNIFVSTPTLKGGRIDTLYQLSDQRRYAVHCLACGRLDWITWSDGAHFRVGWDDRRPETARLECPECQAHLFEPERRMMVVEAARREDKGWLPTTEPQQAGLVGFHVPTMLSTLGKVSLPHLVEAWLTAYVKGKESLRVFTNTKLAEGWEDRTAKTEPHTLLGKREDYGEGIEVPSRGYVLTAGVDVQENRFELQVWAWGFAEERWVVEYRVVPGDPEDDETQNALLQALSRTFAHASGHQLRILSTCIDSGAMTDAVYSFVLKHQARRIYATKGYAKRSGTPIVGKPSEKRRGRDARPVRVYPINVDDAKSQVNSAVALQRTDGDGPKPGYLHFPLGHDTIDEEYFAQLCAETKVTIYKHTVAVGFEWVPHRERNEALDTAVLNIAAFRLLNPNLQQQADAILMTPPGQPPPGPRPPAPSKPAGWLSRPSRDSWLKGRR
jgi:phage terminase large subunit GpA-like protein